MGCNHSKIACGCGNHIVDRDGKEYCLPSCQTEASIEKAEREILRFKARQLLARRKGHLKARGYKRGRKPADNEREHQAPMKPIKNFLGIDTVEAIFDRLHSTVVNGKQVHPFVASTDKEIQNTNDAVPEEIKTSESSVELRNQEKQDDNIISTENEIHVGNNDAVSEELKTSGSSLELRNQDKHENNELSTENDIHVGNNNDAVSGEIKTSGSSLELRNHDKKEDAMKKEAVKNYVNDILCSALDVVKSEELTSSCQTDQSLPQLKDQAIEYSQALENVRTEESVPKEVVRDDVRSYIGDIITRSLDIVRAEESSLEQPTVAEVEEDAVVPNEINLYDYIRSYVDDMITRSLDIVKAEESSLEQPTVAEVEEDAVVPNEINLYDYIRSYVDDMITRSLDIVKAEESSLEQSTALEVEKDAVAPHEINLDDDVRTEESVPKEVVRDDVRSYVDDIITKSLDIVRAEKLSLEQPTALEVEKDTVAPNEINLYDDIRSYVDDMITRSLDIVRAEESSLEHPTVAEVQKDVVDVPHEINLDDAVRSYVGDIISRSLDIVRAEKMSLEQVSKLAIEEDADISSGEDNIDLPLNTSGEQEIPVEDISVPMKGLEKPEVPKDDQLSLVLVNWDDVKVTVDAEIKRGPEVDDTKASEANISVPMKDLQKPEVPKDDQPSLVLVNWDDVKVTVDAEIKRGPEVDDTKASEANISVPMKDLQKPEVPKDDQPSLVLVNWADVKVTVDAEIKRGPEVDDTKVSEANISVPMKDLQKPEVPKDDQPSLVLVNWADVKVTVDAEIKRGPEAADESSVDEEDISVPKKDLDISEVPKDDQPSLVLVNWDDVKVTVDAEIKRGPEVDDTKASEANISVPMKDLQKPEVPKDDQPSLVLVNWADVKVTVDAEIKRGPEVDDTKVSEAVISVPMKGLEKPEVPKDDQPSLVLVNWADVKVTMDAEIKRGPEVDERIVNEEQIPCLEQEESVDLEEADYIMVSWDQVEVSVDGQVNIGPEPMDDLTEGSAEQESSVDLEIEEENSKEMKEQTPCPMNETTVEEIDKENEDIHFVAVEWKDVKVYKDGEVKRGPEAKMASAHEVLIPDEQEKSVEKHGDIPFVPVEWKNVNVAKYGETKCGPEVKQIKSENHIPVEKDATVLDKKDIQHVLSKSKRQTTIKQEIVKEHDIIETQEIRKKQQNQRQQEGKKGQEGEEDQEVQDVHLQQSVTESVESVATGGKERAVAMGDSYALNCSEDAIPMATASTPRKVSGPIAIANAEETAIAIIDSNATAISNSSEDQEQNAAEAKDGQAREMVEQDIDEENERIGQELSIGESVLSEEEDEEILIPDFIPVFTDKGKDALDYTSRDEYMPLEENEVLALLSTVIEDGDDKISSADSASSIEDKSLTVEASTQQHRQTYDPQNSDNDVHDTAKGKVEATIARPSDGQLSQTAEIVQSAKAREDECTAKNDDDVHDTATSKGEETIARPSDGQFSETAEIVQSAKAREDECTAKNDDDVHDTATRKGETTIARPSNGRLSEAAAIESIRNDATEHHQGDSVGGPADGIISMISEGSPEEESKIDEREGKISVARPSNVYFSKTNGCLAGSCLINSCSGQEDSRRNDTNGKGEMTSVRPNAGSFSRSSKFGHDARRTNHEYGSSEVTHKASSGKESKFTVKHDDGSAYSTVGGRTDAKGCNVMSITENNRSQKEDDLSLHSMEVTSDKLPEAATNGIEHEGTQEDQSNAQAPGSVSLAAVAENATGNGTLKDGNDKDKKTRSCCDDDVFTWKDKLYSENEDNHSYPCPDDGIQSFTGDDMHQSEDDKHGYSKQDLDEGQKGTVETSNIESGFKEEERNHGSEEGNDATSTVTSPTFDEMAEEERGPTGTDNNDEILDQEERKQTNEGSASILNITEMHPPRLKDKEPEPKRSTWNDISSTHPFPVATSFKSVAMLNETDLNGVDHPYDPKDAKLESIPNRDVPTIHVQGSPNHQHEKEHSLSNDHQSKKPTIVQTSSTTKKSHDANTSANKDDKCKIQGTSFDDSVSLRPMGNWSQKFLAQNGQRKQRANAFQTLRESSKKNRVKNQSWDESSHIRSSDEDIGSKENASGNNNSSPKHRSDKCPASDDSFKITRTSSDDISGKNDNASENDGFRKHREKECPALNESNKMKESSVVNLTGKKDVGVNFEDISTSEWIQWLAMTKIGTWGPKPYTAEDYEKSGAKPKVRKKKKRKKKTLTESTDGEKRNETIKKEAEAMNGNKKKMEIMDDKKKEAEDTDSRNKKTEFIDGRKKEAETMDGNEKRVEIMDDKKKEAETMDGNEKGVEIMDDKKEAEAMDENEKRVEIMDDKKKEAEAMDENEKRVEIMDDKKKEAETMDGNEKGVEIMDDKKKEAETMDGNEKGVEIMDDKKKEAGAMDENEKRVEIMDDKKEAETMDENEKRVEIMDDKQKEAESTDRNEKETEFIEGNKKKSESMDDKEADVEARDYNEKKNDKKKEAETTEGKEREFEFQTKEPTWINPPPFKVPSKIENRKPLFGKMEMASRLYRSASQKFKEDHRVNTLLTSKSADNFKQGPLESLSASLLRIGRKFTRNDCKYSILSSSEEDDPGGTTCAAPLRLRSHDETLFEKDNKTKKDVNKFQNECDAEDIMLAIQEFNQVRQVLSLDGPVSTGLVYKFLYARDYDVDDATRLYKNYLSLRRVYHNAELSPLKDPLHQELYSGSFTILDVLDESGAAIAVFTAQLHKIDISHEVVMNNIYLQLDEAIKSLEIQRKGIILIYDFSNISYKNCDVHICSKILELFQSAYPVHLKKTYIVSPPFWFEPEMRLFSASFRDANMRKNIHIVTQSKLKTHLPLTCIPRGLGGQCEANPIRLIKLCITSHKDRVGLVESNAETSETSGKDDTMSRDQAQINVLGDEGQEKVENDSEDSKDLGDPNVQTKDV